MLRYLSIATVLLSAQSAFAHPGHIEQVSGHSHYLAAGALVLAAAIAVGLIQKYRGTQRV